MTSSLETALGNLANSGEITRASDGLWMDTPELDVTCMVALLLELEARLSTITAIALESGETEVIYHFMVRSTVLNIKVRTHKNAIPSITPIMPAADWIEREIHDLYAVEFLGHPHLERFIRPPELPIGFFREAGGEAGKQQRAQAQRDAS
jgi:NADH:ubiquinone oxidoreductase subunit C